jgi:hypothetical protein
MRIAAVLFVGPTCSSGALVHVVHVAQAAEDIFGNAAMGSAALLFQLIGPQNLLYRVNCWLQLSVFKVRPTLSSLAPSQ